MFDPSGPFPLSVMFLSKAGAYPREALSRVGSWPYPEIVHLDTFSFILKFIFEEKRPTFTAKSPSLCTVCLPNHLRKIL